jgi:hypothetical protein
MAMGPNDDGDAIPGWLRDATPERRLPLRQILEGCIYYPACRIDGVVFSRIRNGDAAGLSFVHADYSISREELDEALERPVPRGGQGLLGYRIAFRRPVRRGELQGPRYKPPAILTEEEQRRAVEYYRFAGLEGPEDVDRKAYCEWVVFDRLRGYDAGHGPRRLSLLYMRADGAAAYHALFVARRIAPRTLVVKQPGHGFGGNYTNFFAEDGPLRRVVAMGQRQPKFLAFGGLGTIANYRQLVWSGYQLFIEKGIGGQHQSLVIARRQT